MCTVSFVANKESFILTSNRDEEASRQANFSGEFQEWNGTNLLFPKDPKAGGSWFAMSETGNVGILLNGAFVSHESLAHYKRSRGLILLDCMASDKPSEFIQNADLSEIEPFTLVIFERNVLLEFRWDGKLLHAENLDNRDCYIWSSAKLYASQTIVEREELFRDFMVNNNGITAESIVDFHSSQEGETQNGFVIKKGGVVETLSITQVEFSRKGKTFFHKNLMTDDAVTIDID